MSTRIACRNLSKWRTVRRISSTASASSIDPEEVAKFSKASAEWWDPHGQFEMLHKMNPVRVGYIKDKVYQHLQRQQPGLLHKPFKGLNMLDVGCGGGLLSESLTRLGGQVTGLDASPENVNMARYHAESDPLLPKPTYRAVTAEDLLSETGGSVFDAVCSLEVIEHVNDPKSFVQTLCQLVKPQGLVFLSTINRTAVSNFLTIQMAEQVLKWVPPGTHDHSKYVTPEEISSFVNSTGDSKVVDITGVTFNPLLSKWMLLSHLNPASLLMNYFISPRFSVDMDVTNLDASTFPGINITWANEQQWNAGLTDGEVFPLADPNGMFSGSVDQVPVSCITAMKAHPYPYVQYEKNVGFIGYYIVRDPANRKKGYGLELFKNAMNYLGPDCNVGLDGVVEQQGNYEKSGFKKHWDNIRFFGKASTQTPLPLSGVANVATKDPSASVVTAIAEFEATFSGMRRPDTFISAWLSNQKITSVVLSSNGGKDILAFGSIRPSASGYRIGPLYAKSEEAAKHVAASLVNSVGKSDDIVIYADVCMANPKAPQVFESVGLSGVGGFVTGRMWTKGVPITQDAISGVYAVMTLEIG
ncbi:hypothetical protein HDU97_005844 [Phlyctochytrium planicorne]|nr:hypothetical protein HDU97_005844 [Phlyctochytrium planicorne]